MSSSKKKQSISEQINEVLKPKDLVEETDEDEAKFEEFTEHSDVVHQLSDIRKQTAKNLSELDSKYKGKIVSRKELEQEESEHSEESSADEEENGNGYNYATDSEDNDNSEDDVEENEDEDELSDQSSEAPESDDDLGEDYDLSQFTKPSSSSLLATVSSTDPAFYQEIKILEDTSLKEEIQKGICVQNQLKLWEKLLEVRIKSQKMLITANSLPDSDAHLELLSGEESNSFSEKVEQTCDSLHGLLDNLLELQSTLVSGFPETKDVLTNLKRKKDRKSSGGIMKRSKLAEYSDLLETNHNDYSSYRNEVLQKWHDRTKGVKNMKNPAANLNIMTKIENALLGKADTIRKTQLYRGDYEIYGVEKPEANEDGTFNELQLPEIFDDSEFYHQLLRELIEYKSSTDENQSEITRKFIELQKVRNKMKKKVDTRASKGRKIRYVVHNKLVNFMPPKDDSVYTEEARNELFNSLFGMANHSETL